ncbi:MAG: PAS domain-containing protein [Chloroflexi bacterium]|nr:PAS domain-containing protein [Chloroflexota bacterium]
MRWAVLLAFVAFVGVTLGLAATLPSSTTLDVALVAAAIVIMAGALLTYALALRRQIRDMGHTARALQPGQPRTSFRAEGGDQVAPLALALDGLVSRFEQALTSLASEHGTLQAVLDNMHDAVLMVDQDRHIVLVNPAFESLFQARGEKAAGRPVLEVILDHEVALLLEQCMRTGKAHSTLLNIGPEHRPFQVRGTAFQAQGRTTALVIFHDQTEAQRVDRTRSEFVANVSHELRTPLASIKAMVETLEQSALEDREAAGHFLSRINTEIDRMTAMIDDLLALSNIESGHVPLHLRPVEIAPLLHDAALRMKPQTERQGLTVNVQASPDVSRVIADPTRIMEVLTNLLDNAVKFTPSGGFITLTARPETGSVHIQVQDTGVGIAKEDLPHIFERFYKADRSRASEGTGLGLAIAKHLVLAHKGTIKAESAEGRGSTFTFTLPAAPSHR